MIILVMQWTFSPYTTSFEYRQAQLISAPRPTLQMTLVTSSHAGVESNTAPVYTSVLKVTCALLASSVKAFAKRKLQFLHEHTESSTRKGKWRWGWMKVRSSEVMWVKTVWISPLAML